MKNKLTALEIKKAPPGKLQDDGGLYLVKRNEGGKWVFRYSFEGKRREMGLGRWPQISLASARTARDEWSSEISRGFDPIGVRHDRRGAERARRERRDPTFHDMAWTVFEARKATLRGGGIRGRWMSPLSLHVFPAIGHKVLSSITPEDVVIALRPIWHEKYPTAKKAIERTRIVFQEAQLMGLDCEPFTVDAAKRQLGAVNHTATPLASTPWQDMPDLFRIFGTDKASHRCLRWIMLSVARMEACRATRLTEICDGVWTVPADRVKGQEGRVHPFRIPMSGSMQEIVSGSGAIGDVLFPGNRDSPITNAAVEKAMRETGVFGTPHGFRASFRTWAQDNEIAWDAAETALGHTIGGLVERAYARSDLLERRRPVMERWANYLDGGKP